MPQRNDLSRSDTPLEQDETLIAVVELSQASWLVAGIVPAVERQPLKKIEADEAALLRLLGRWTDEATRAGRAITRVCVAFEAGRDGFWLARRLRARGVEAHVIHPTSVAVSREHRRAKTDRLDTELLERAFLGWLRGERGHCATAAIPTAGRRTPSARTGSTRAWSASAPDREPDEERPGQAPPRSAPSPRTRSSAGTLSCTSADVVVARRTK